MSLTRDFLNTLASTLTPDLPSLPERRLLAAMFEDGISIYLRTKVASAEDQAAADAWVREVRWTWGGFEFVCESLGVDPAAARKQLRLAKRGGAPITARIRRTRDWSENLRIAKLRLSSERRRQIALIAAEASRRVRAARRRGTNVA